MAPPQRIRFNAKARGSTAGGKSKSSKSKRGQVAGANSELDANAEMLGRKSEVDKEDDRREKLRLELASESNSKLTSKKRKRLDSYITKKLKKEERVIVMQKLAKSQAELSSTMNLQSSSTLGSGKLSTAGQRLAKDEDKETRKALDGRSGHRKRRRKEEIIGEEDAESSEDDLDVAGPTKSREAPVSRPCTTPPTTAKLLELASNIETTSTQPVISTSAVGAALRRNADGTTMQPRTLKRKRKSKRVALHDWTGSKSHNNANSDVTDSSFDSSAESSDADSDASEKASESGDKSGGSSSIPSGEDEEEEDDEEGANGKRKRPGFKAWALKQVAVAKQQDELIAIDQDDTTTIHAISTPIPLNYKPRQDPELIGLSGPLGAVLKIPETALATHLQSTTSSSKDVSTQRSKNRVAVSRTEDIIASRMMLPVLSEEQSIVETILLNPVVVICGETGSGKTTQIPQFLFEAGFGSPGTDNPGMIGITQPRRVAAMSMASRVASELSLPPSRVSYQIRYDATVSPATSIKFMTDGVLLRELSADFLLSKYSVIIVDEAHERSINTDILIGVLSRVLKLREELWKKKDGNIKPLRLVIMSATLRISDFAQNTTLFPTAPPIIKIDSRQHDVTVHFNRKTVPDYVGEAVRKTMKIHTRLPPGGILIFLTGQGEIEAVCRKLERRFGKRAVRERVNRRAGHAAKFGGENDDEPLVVSDVNPRRGDVEVEDLNVEIIEDAFAVEADENGDADPEALDTDSEDEEDDVLSGITETNDPMHIVPLYSLLPSAQQMKVFQPPPMGARLVVVSTNVAETSLTIPGIRYVVDCGRAKQRSYDPSNGIQSFQIGWISKASATQRAGRAGRTGPGHCYRLYSSAFYENHFEQFSQPEIHRVPIEGVVLQMKSMHIDAVENFPFPTPPDRNMLRNAQMVLTHLGALQAPNEGVSKGGVDAVAEHSVTELGKAMSLFPVSPRYAKMLVASQQQGCLPYVVAIVAALSVGDPFLREHGLNAKGEEEEEEEIDDNVRSERGMSDKRRAFFQSQQLHSSLGKSTSDVFRVLSVVGAYEYAGGGAHEFCAQNFVRLKAMDEIHKLRSQISSIVQSNFPGVKGLFNPKLPPPNETQLKILRQVLAAGFIDQVAIRKDLTHKSSSGAKFASARGIAYQALGVAEDVFIHPSSILFHQPPAEFVVFQDIVRTSSVYMKGLTAINPAWLPTLGASLCTFSKPLDLPASMKTKGVEMVVPRFGPNRWELPPVKAPKQKS